MRHLAQWMQQPVPIWILAVLLCGLLLLAIYYRRSRKRKQSISDEAVLNLARRLDRIEDDLENLTVAGKIIASRQQDLENNSAR